MPTLLIPVLLSLLQETKTSSPTVHIPTSRAVWVARAIARDLGYDPDGPNIFSDSLGSAEKPLVQGYTSIGIYVNGHILSTISIDRVTGQTIDMFGCEVYDFPDMRSFQDGMLRLTKARRKTPQELAEDMACVSP